MLTAIGLAAIEDDAILLVLKKGVWILPGGKPSHNESDTTCLAREIGEELPEASFTIGECYGDFEGITPHGNEMICVTVFLGTVSGDITPAAEISDARRFTKDELAEVPTSEITRQIIAALIRDEILK